MESFIEQYRHGHSQLLAAIDGLTDEQLQFKPSETSWSIREILIHVADAELVHVHRMKAVLAEENPLLTAFDQDKWSLHLHYQSLDHTFYVALFAALRDSFAPILEGLTESDFARTGTHNHAGVMSFQDILVHSIEHVTDHIQQIGRVKALLP